jgi:hypothetical protein
MPSPSSVGGGRHCGWLRNREDACRHRRRGEGLRGLQLYFGAGLMNRKVGQHHDSDQGRRRQEY